MDDSEEQSEQAQLNTTPLFEEVKAGEDPLSSELRVTESLSDQGDKLSLIHI